ncbi:MAG: hypothetical protein V4556_04605 [Bacteroidota bacterium]
MKKAIKTKPIGEELDSTKRGYNEKNPAQPQGPFKPDSSQQPIPASNPKKEKGLKRK